MYGVKHYLKYITIGISESTFQVSYKKEKKKTQFHFLKNIMPYMH